MTQPNLQTFQCLTPEDTTALAIRLARVLRGGDCISLEGDLGAGKTHFSRALARALGVQGPVTSPTFVLQKTYAISGNATITQLAHYDFYRITSYDELLDMGFEDHDEQTLVLAEWGDLFISELPGHPVRIKFETQPDDSRLITLSGLSFPVPPN